MSEEEYGSRCPECHFTFRLHQVKIGVPFNCLHCNTVLHTTSLYNNILKGLGAAFGFTVAYRLGFSFLPAVVVGSILTMVGSIALVIFMRWLVPPKLIKDERDYNPLSIL